jgi:hypothetical protein
MNESIVLRSLCEAVDDELCREAMKWAQAPEKEAKKRLADNNWVRYKCKYPRTSIIRSLDIFLGYASP